MNRLIYHKILDGDTKDPYLGMKQMKKEASVRKLTPYSRQKKTQNRYIVNVSNLFNFCNSGSLRKVQVSQAIYVFNLAGHLHNANRVKNVPYGILRIKNFRNPPYPVAHTCIYSVYRPDMGLIPPRTAIPQYVQRLK